MWMVWMALLLSFVLAHEDASGDPGSGESGSGSGETGGGSDDNSNTAVVVGAVGGVAAVAVVGAGIAAATGAFGTGASSIPVVATLAKIGAASRSGSLPMMPAAVNKNEV